MIQLNFRDCTLAYLDETFAPKQIFDSQSLSHWLKQENHISDFEKEFLARFQEKLIRIRFTGVMSSGLTGIL